MGPSIAIVIISLILSAFFSGMEIAFLSANKLKLELRKKQEGITSRILSIFTENTEQYIATMLVGNNIALVVYGIEMTNLLTPWLEQSLPSPSAILLTQTLIGTFIILITAEFLPKSLFRIHPNTLVNLFAIPVYLFYLLFYPISKFTTWISFGLLRSILRLKIKREESKPIFGKVDLDHLVDEATLSGTEQEHGHLQELKIFQNALDFSEIRIRDCMIPRTDIVAIEISSSIGELIKKFSDSKYSRLPVYRDTIDNIIGYVNSKDLFLNPTTIESKLIPIDFLPETMHANKTLAKFIKEHKSIAIVVDEFGGTAGLVTIEDIIEEIFGEIDDEHDKSDLIEKQIDENTFILSGRLEIKHLNEALLLEIPETDEYETLAGFILHHHQNIPKPGEKIEIEPYNLEILKMNKTRIELVRLIRRP